MSLVIWDHLGLILITWHAIRVVENSLHRRNKVVKENCRLLPTGIEFSTGYQEETY